MLVYVRRVNITRCSLPIPFQTCGEVLTSSDFFRSAHNSLSPPHSISLEGLNLPKSTEDAYHFVVYLPHAGSIYELDGLKHYPVKHGAYVHGGEGWLAKARCVNNVLVIGNEKVEEVRN